MTVIRTAVRLALLPAALLTLAGPARAQFITTKYVETGVSYPGVGTLTFFPAPPSLSAGRVAFAASVGPGPGIFTATPGAPVLVANTSTPIPGGNSPFTTFAGSPVGLSASGVAFGGNGFPGPGNAGVYTNMTGSLTPVVNNVTPYPGPGGGFFNGFSIPAVSGTAVAFGGSNGPPMTALGVFTRNGSGPIVPVATTATTVPGGAGTFTNFADPMNGPTLPSISGSNVAFVGQGGGRLGVFASLVTALVPVATNATPVPGGVGNFTSFGAAPVIDGTTVAFYGTDGVRPGVYAWTPGGGLARVADTTLPVPGGSGTFASFTPNSVSISGTRVTFRATSSTGQAGIYTGVPGALQKVVATGDVIDGRTVTSVDASRFASAGVDTAVLLGFGGGPTAVYVFSPVPEPAGLLAIGAVGLVAARAWRRKRARI
jgi:hypothetical protein